MCGIRLLVLEQTIDTATDNHALEQNSINNTSNHHHVHRFEPPLTLQRRGPDGCGEQYLKHENRQVILQASVLQMRDEFIQQPVFAQAPFVAWNGELYQRKQSNNNAQQQQQQQQEEVWQHHISDTTVVAHAIQSILLEHKDDPTINIILEQLARFCSTLINAEYAFCVVTETAIYYGRDPLGRRSLLVYYYQQSASSSANNNSTIMFELASVATNTTHQVWNEVPPGRVYGYTWRDGRLLSSKTFQIVPQPHSLHHPTTFDQAALQLMQLLEMAVRRRVSLLHTAIAVLFSGGLDSVVLAALTLKVVPPSCPVVLVNVSFVETKDSTDQFHKAAADTQAAWTSYQELQQLFPEHTNVRFISHQVDWNEIQNVEPHIRTLMYPKDGTMDLNIATALWFAAQAAAPARILLSGLGADEQMAGYGRHRKAWEQGQAEALRKELDLDVNRLWERNLGRDDRILSDHGTEARYPFLDTNVMSYLATLPLHFVCDFSLPPGQGDKRILRRVAECLGVQTASSMVKRAIQFGSRISHVCDKKRFGSRRKATVGASKGAKQQENTN